MSIHFSSSEALNSHFFGVLAVLACMVVLLGIVATIQNRTSTKTIDVRTGMAVFACLLGIVAVVTYLTTYTRFVAMDISVDAVKLHFVGLRAHTETIPLAAVNTVLWGTDGKNKGSSGCHLRLVKMSGESVSSAEWREKVEICQEVRQKIISLYLAK